MTSAANQCFGNSIQLIRLLFQDIQVFLIEMFCESADPDCAIGSPWVFGGETSFDDEQTF